MANIKMFPKEVFVYVEDDRDDSYLVASTDRDSALGDEQERIVGVYQFVSAEELVRGDVLAKTRKSRSAR